MMGEEHLGDPPPRVEYHVDPFVERVRQHYERIAKKNPEAKADASQPTVPVQGSAPNDSVSNRANQSAPPSTQPHPKTKKLQREPAPFATEVPSPDFLVQSHSISPTAIVGEQPTSSNMWLLLGLIAFPIAPGIFWASAAMSRKDSDASQTKST